jgi:hypothetical protein
MHGAKVANEHLVVRSIPGQATLDAGFLLALLDRRINKQAI